LKGLNGKNVKYFKDLCHFAYKMTTNFKQVTTSQDASDNLSEKEGLDLLTICAPTKPNWHSSEL